MNWFLAYFTLGWMIRIGFIPTVLRRNFAPGAAIAWLGVVFFHPYIGLLLYLIFGERRLGPGRLRHHNALLTHYAVANPHTPPPALDAAQELVRLAAKVGRMPPVPASAAEWFTDSVAMVERLAADIDAATSHVHLLYYIFASDQSGERVAVALRAAAQRGVTCRVLLDQFASRRAFRRRGLAAHLKRAGVQVVAALPSSPLRRRDLRNHRKLAIIDDRIAYAGSQNLINADYGGKRGAPWVDLTARYTGPVIAELATVFVSDWAFETDVELAAPSPETIPPVQAGMPMQVVPTGPASRGESFRRLFQGAVDTAQHRMVLTTPYFVPDESTVLALLTAADRGVEVILILPERADSIFTAAAGRAHFAMLLEAGITIHLYQPGLLHAKLVTIDDTVALFGSANLDVRSFHLNFELTTLLYGAAVTDRLYGIQRAYIAQSRRLEPTEWAKRSALTRYFDSAVSLISPLL